MLLLAGCSHGDGQATAASSTPTKPPRTTSTSASTSASASANTSSATPAPRHTPGVPTPGSMEKPATSSGTLSKRSFPTPRQLGAGWRYAVDPGSTEEGYAGNGTPALARDPREVVQTAVPIGCPRPAALPVPSHALEVDYRLGTRTVIAVRGRFPSSREAATFFRARTQDLRSCAGRSGSAAIGALVTAIRPLAPGAVASDRTPASDPWHEIAVLDDDTVVLVALQGRQALTATRTGRLVHQLRG